MPLPGTRMKQRTPHLGRLMRSYRRMWKVQVGELSAILRVSDRQLRRYERGACPPATVVKRFVDYGVRRHGAEADKLTAQLLNAAVTEDVSAAGPEAV